MDKQLIEKVALEVVHKMDEDLPTLSMEGSDKWHIEFASRFLSRIDAERGKEAVAIYKYQPATLSYGVQWLINTPLPNDTKLFLSAPTIPEGMALVPIEPTDAMLAAIQSSGWMPGNYSAMLAAAKGERNGTE